MRGAWKNALIVGATAIVAAAAMPPPTVARERIAVEADVLRYVSDAGSDDVMPRAAFPDAQVFWDIEESGVGPGCRYERRELPPPSPDQRLYDIPETRCSLAGVVRMEFLMGPGDDRVPFYSADALLLPTLADMGPGDDRYDLGSWASDQVLGGDGNDFLLNGAGGDVIDGGPGNDTVYGPDFGDNGDRLAGGEGDDSLAAAGGDDVLAGGPGADHLQPDAGDDVAEGGDGDDVLGSTTSTPPLCGLDRGRDRLSGGPQNDLVCGGEGPDSISGGEGDDRITSLDQERDELVECGPGADVVWADAADQIGIDCEYQAQPGPVPVGSTGSLELPLRCPFAVCTGTVDVALVPGAELPAGRALPPEAPARARGQRLARAPVRIRSGRRFRVRLSRAGRRRLSRSRGTPVEARLSVRRPGGRRQLVRRVFPVRAARRR